MLNFCVNKQIGEIANMNFPKWQIVIVKAEKEISEHTSFEYKQERESLKFDSLAVWLVFNC